MIFSGNTRIGVKIKDINNNSKTIGLVHAGWRGLSLGIINEFVNNINSKENTSDYYALIGPSIQSCCFKIKDDVLSYFDSMFYEQFENNQYKVDLQKWAVEQLIESGLEKSHISVINRCTHCLNTIYHSYRRNKSNPGRMYALLGWSN